MRRPSTTRHTNAIIEYNSLFLSTKMKALSKALEQGNSSEIESTLKELKEMIDVSSGNQIYSAFIMRNTPEIFYASEFGVCSFSESSNADEINGLTKIFSLFKIKSAKNNILFLTYLFETLLNKLDEADQNLKNIVLAVFSESKNVYADALQFYLSQLSPEKIKSILCGNKLITKIIDIKPTSSKELDLRNTLNELKKYQEEGLYSARENLCKKLKIEINRLRNKNFLSTSDIELSNILVRIRIDLKKSVTLFSSHDLEISLNVEIGQAKQIQSQKKLDTETAALLLTIKMIKSWYLSEYQKDEKIFFEKLLSIVSAPILPAEPDYKNPVVKKEAIAAAETKKSYFVAEKTVAVALSLSAAITPRIVTPQQKAVTTERAYPSFFDAISAEIEEVGAMVIPTHNPAVAALRVPKGSIKRDIVDELFYPVECKI